MLYNIDELDLIKKMKVSDHMSVCIPVCACVSFLYDVPVSVCHQKRKEKKKAVVFLTAINIIMANYHGMLLKPATLLYLFFSRNLKYYKHHH